MMLGMSHCAGGEGPNVFDKIAVMEHGVETGRAGSDRRVAQYWRER